MNTPDILLLDGGMGTMLQAAGLPLGELPEVWNITHPEAVISVHRRYAEAGSRVLYTNTFGANRFKAAASGYSSAAPGKPPGRTGRSPWTSAPSAS